MRRCVALAGRSDRRRWRRGTRGGEFHAQYDRVVGSLLSLWGAQAKETVHRVLIADPVAVKSNSVDMSAFVLSTGDGAMNAVRCLATNFGFFGERVVLACVLLRWLNSISPRFL